MAKSGDDGPTVRSDMLFEGLDEISDKSYPPGYRGFILNLHPVREIRNTRYIVNTGQRQPPSPDLSSSRISESIVCEKQGSYVLNNTNVINSPDIISSSSTD